jgi:hypothetical protein
MRHQCFRVAVFRHRLDAQERQLPHQHLVCDTDFLAR